jgi:NFACT protein RNA binding domain/NFACT protein C-terminal domain
LYAHAKAVERNASNVDKALLVVNSALDSGMDWDQLEQLVQVEQENRNPIAMLIQGLDLEKDEIVMRLAFDPYDEESEQYNVRIMLNETAHGNASAMFARYRSSKEKAQKTLEVTDVAVKAAEETAKRQLAEAQKKGRLIVTGVQRKPAWYEKFHWFITSDNYLVIGGKDAHQNETLVKRYLRPGDAYLHADVHGASSCVLRAKRRRKSDGTSQPVPLSAKALTEAGSFTICRSSAWSSRMVTSAWWVEAHQVSKTAPTGEYLTVGSFMVRGKKNYLPPSQLELGLGVLFRIGNDEDSLARHKNERRDFALMELEESGALSDSQDKPPRRDVAVEDDGDEDGDMTGDGELLQSSQMVSMDSIVIGSDMGDKASKVAAGIGANDITKGKKKGGLSARDRKLLKKYGSLEKKNETNQSDLRKGESQAKQQEDNQEKSTGKKANETTKRGKKTKMKRAMTKYGEQDEEDRMFAMKTLQGGEKSERKLDGKNRLPTSEEQEKAAIDTAAVLAKDSQMLMDRLSVEVLDILVQCMLDLDGNDDDPLQEIDADWSRIDAEVLEQLLSLEPPAQIAAARRLLELRRSVGLTNYSSSLIGIIRTIQKYGYKSSEPQQQKEEVGKTEEKTEDRNGVDTVADAGAANDNSTLDEGAHEKSRELDIGGDGGNLDVDSKAITTDEEKELAAEDKQDEGEVKERDASKDADGDEDANDDDSESEDAIDDTTELNKLTGKPCTEDALLYAVPVCAPYQTLSQYTFRVKLTPGNLKRGKAVKECIDIITKKELSKTITGFERYRDLIKRLGDNDWVQVMCADVKIVTAGSSKTAKSKGKGKK